MEERRVLCKLKQKISTEIVCDPELKYVHLKLRSIQLTYQQRTEWRKGDHLLVAASADSMTTLNYPKIKKRILKICESLIHSDFIIYILPRLFRGMETVFWMLHLLIQ